MVRLSPEGESWGWLQAHHRLHCPGACYRRHEPEETRLYQIVQQHYPAFLETMQSQGTPLPAYVQEEFEAYLKCGRLEHGFLRVRCKQCHHERLVAFSCKKRGFCPSCGARRMADGAALLADEIMLELPIRQWVISFPYQLRYLFAAYPAMMGYALAIIYRVISTYLIHQAGYSKQTATTGAVTLIQRFGSALNLNVHLMCMEADTMQSLYSHSITYRIAMGPRQGSKVFTLQTVPERPQESPNDPGSSPGQALGSAPQTGFQDRPLSHIHVLRGIRKSVYII